MNRGKKVLALLCALAWTAWAVPSHATQPRWRVNVASGHCIGKHAHISPGGNYVQMELTHCKHALPPRPHGAADPLQAPVGPHVAERHAAP